MCERKGLLLIIRLLLSTVYWVESTLPLAIFIHWFFGLSREEILPLLSFLQLVTQPKS